MLKPKETLNEKEQRRKSAEQHLDKFSTQDLITIFRMAREVDSDYLNGRFKKIARECGFDQENPTNFIDQAIKKAMIDPDFENFIREELVDALSVEAGSNEKSYRFLKNLNIEKLANLAISKKCSDEETKHTDVLALHAQPGSIKAPRLVK